MKSHQHFSLKKNNSFAVSAIAPVIYYPTNEKELQSLSYITENEFYILGEGSNTLFIENKTPVVIKPEFLGISIDETPEFYDVSVACSENWHRFVCFCLEQGINGLENLALIPGSVGAAPVQNIGAYGVEVADFIKSVTWFSFQTNKSELLNNAQCEFDYRASIFKKNLKNKGIITHVTFRFPKNWQAVLNYKGLSCLPKNSNAIDIMNTVISIRNSKLPDPKLIPNAGSFFKNPIISSEIFSLLKITYPDIPFYLQEDGCVKLAAGWLIEASGLKGYQTNGAAVHEKQALVLTNANSASGASIKSLASDVQRIVYERFKISLQPEVRMVAEHGEITLGDLN